MHTYIHAYIHTHTCKQTQLLQFTAPLHALNETVDNKV